jgi:multidrug efflux pump subunit AcrA (membrane-fusion protein)
VVPATAVQNLKNLQIVFLATDTPGVFLMRPVRVGAENNGRVPVLEGVTAGERVVTDGSFLLRAEWLKLHPGN